MILSKKYKEELDKIVMSEDMKKRILHNVLNENIEAKSNEIPVKKYGSLKRNMQMIAACFAVVVCVSVIKNNPQILKVKDRNMEQEEMYNGKDGENKILPSGKVEQSDDVSKNSSKSEDVIGNSSEAKDTSKSESESNNKNESRDVAQSNGQIANSQNVNNKGKNIENVNNEVRNDKIDNGGANNLENNSSDQAPKISNGHSGNADKSEVSGSLDSSDNSENTNSNYNGGDKSKYDNGNSPKEKQKESSSVSLVASSNKSIGPAPEGSVDENTETQKPIDSDNSLKNSVINKDGTNNANKSEDSQLVMGGNPIKEYKTLEEAEDAVKFKISTIKSMPKGFNIDNLSVISNEIIEITYENSEQDVINFRAGKEIENISGDYNIYKVENTVNINSMSVELRGNNNKINLAAWKKGEISYSIYSMNGSDGEEILNMIRSSL